MNTELTTVGTSPFWVRVIQTTRHWQENHMPLHIGLISFPINRHCRYFPNASICAIFFFLRKINEVQINESTNIQGIEAQEPSKS